jgi:hypothetical protein
VKKYSGGYNIFIVAKENLGNNNMSIFGVPLTLKKIFNNVVIMVQLFFGI